MKSKNILESVVLIQDKKVISPNLITIREYGRWLQEVFDEYTCNQELFLKSKESGQSVLQYHPGTRIGNWFDRAKIYDVALKSWFVLQDSTVMTKLKGYKLAELRDAIPISVTDQEGRRMLRLYTASQIELYIRTNLDRQFSIAKYLTTPKQIKVSAEDVDKIIVPQQAKQRKRLF